ncbi:MAG TPA: nucleotidyltransferase family protein [Longimicrobiales bacterium]|nr:nucleotidyltransferase family protein [Longimicrobiales bacterium]
MLCSDLARTRTLLPLLSRSVVRNGLDMSPGVLSYLRAATLREELRAERLRPIGATALSALERAGVNAFVVRGVTLAATVYERWPLRHCHDLDLLVAPAELTTAVRALAAADCVPVGPALGPRAGARLQHTSGMGLAVHTRPFGVGFYDAPVEHFARPDRCIRVAGASARTVSSEATLVHVLGHATYSASRRNLRWVTDAWHLLAAGTPLDWDDIVVRLDAYRLTLPVAVLLRYISEFGMEVPADVLVRVTRRAQAATSVAEDVALGGALAARSGDLRTLWRSTRSWRSRARFARWLVAPSPAYMRSTFRVESAWLYPLLYACRPVRFVTTRFV